MTTTPEALDAITVDLVFALRDSLTDVSRLDFWQGRAATAIETAAAGSETWSQAVTTAARKLQIDTLSNEAAKAVTRLADQLGDDYEAWASHIARNVVYIVALANVQRDARKKPSRAATADHATPAESTERPMF